MYELSQSAITDADQTGGSEDTFLFTHKKSLSHRSLRKTGGALWLLGWARIRKHLIGNKSSNTDPQSVDMGTATVTANTYRCIGIKLYTNI